MKKKSIHIALLLTVLFAVLLSAMGNAQNVQAAASKKAWKKIKGVCYNGSGKKIPGAITRGIDVSSWQDAIDWEKVKNSDVDFAFIRICHGIAIKDVYCERNLTNANLAGVPVGTYVYSMATTQAMAILEAQYAISAMKGHTISYPVVLDLEDSSLEKLTSDKLAKVAAAFINEIKKAGYYPMVYCNLSWYNEKLNPAGLTDYDVWIARYGDTIQPPDKSIYRYSIWQGTDGNTSIGLMSTKGLVDGIPRENGVDIDFGFVDYTKIVTPRTGPVASYVPTTVTWVTYGGSKYYYVNNVPVTGWYTIDGNEYYFDNNGKLKKNKLVKDADGNIRFTDSNGIRVKKSWVTYKKKQYYVRSNGYAAKGIVKISKKYYYFHNKNAYLLYKNKKITVSSGNIYYFDKDGARYDKGFLTLKEKGKKNTYYFGKNGVAYRGWKKINKKKYYFRPNGVMAKNTRLKNETGTKTYVFDKDGVLVKTIKNKTK